MLSVNHEGGFFSCTTVKLYRILEYFRRNKKLPVYIEGKGLFKYYKPSSHKDSDITSHFFKTDSSKIIPGTGHVRLQLFDHVKPLRTIIDFEGLIPYVERYYMPSPEIKTLISNLEEKYKIDYENTCGVYYRGTDKKTETTIAEYTLFYDKMRELQKSSDSSLKFLIMTDTGPFIDDALKLFDNLIILEENKPSYDGKCLHINTEKDNNYEQVKLLLAVVIILSRCKHVIVPSSNVSYWIALYRKNCDNLYQVLNNKWC